MRKENHYIFILLMGITIRLGTDKKLNQLYLAKREIRMVRTVLETGTKKIHCAGTSSIPVHFWRLLSSSYRNLLKFLFPTLKECSIDCHLTEKYLYQLSSLNLPCNTTTGHSFPQPPGPPVGSTVPGLKQRKWPVVGKEGFLSVKQQPGSPNNHHFRKFNMWYS